MVQKTRIEFSDQGNILEISPIIFKVLLNNEPVNCTLDTGSQKNYITSEIVQRLRLDKKTENDNQIKIQVDNGNINITKIYINPE